jgi:predicted alpha/beta-fold hydrolase
MLDRSKRTATEGYRAPRWMPGGHLQTLLPFLWPSRQAEPRSERLIVEVEPGTSVEVLVSRPELPAPRGTLLLVHGLGGSAGSRHPVETAHAALQRGWAVARVNLRNCGGTAELASTLFNAVQSDDIGAVLRALDAHELPRPFAVLGFSLGGTLTLRYAGHAGDGNGADVVAAINAPIDLGASAAIIDRPANTVFKLAYTYALCRMLNEIREHRHVPGPPARWHQIRSIRRFDELYVVPSAGFAHPDEYYAAASAAPTLDAIRRPTLVIASRNDPLVPVETFEAQHGRNGRIRYHHPAEGGHMGYWQRRGEFWAADAALDGIEALLEG